MPDECKNHSKAFASPCLLFFIVKQGIFKGYVNIPVAFYSLCGIILRLQKEVIGSGLENTFKNHVKEHSGRGNNFFLYSIFYFTTFF